MKLKVIITGASGMVGEGVLHECLQHDQIESVLVVGRNSCNVLHPKLKEIIHKDFFDLTPIETQLSGYDACLFCLGVSSVGMKESQFNHLTYDLTMNFANTLVKYNSNMVFCYISGSGTDSTEKGKRMWARVKGKTENSLAKLPFKRVYNFRPGYMQPTKGLKNTLGAYKYISWMYPLLRLLFPKFVTTLKELGLAMIHAVSKGYSKQTIEVTDIVALSKQ